MEERELIRSLTVPMYRRDYTMSEAANPKYFQKGKKHKLPLEYCDKVRYKAEKLREPDNIKYMWREFAVVRDKVKCMVDFLVHKATGERVVFNPERVGKPTIQNINGQAFYSGKLFRGQKDKMLGSIKDQLRQYVMSLPKIDRFPLMIEVELHDVIDDIDYSNNQRWDVGNRWYPYGKCFEDVLKSGRGGCGIIPDDDRLHITKPPAVIFCPVDTTNERKLIFNLYVDRRPIILNNKRFQNEHGTKLG